MNFAVNFAVSFSVSFALSPALSLAVRFAVSFVWSFAVSLVLSFAVSSVLSFAVRFVLNFVLDERHGPCQCDVVLMHHQRRNPDHIHYSRIGWHEWRNQGAAAVRCGCQKSDHSHDSSSGL